MSAQVVALKQANPDAVILGVIPKHGALFVKEAQRLGWKPKVVGHNTVADPVVLDLAGAEALEGVYVNLMTAVDSMDTPGRQEGQRDPGEILPADQARLLSLPRHGGRRSSSSRR